MSRLPLAVRLWLLFVTVLTLMLSAWPAQSSQIQPQAIWLMGEVHDHPLGHDYRMRDLKAALGHQWRPAILMEQFDTERQDDLTRAWQTCKQAQCVVDMAGGSGWQWPLYLPLIQLALDYRLPLVAANVSRAQLSGVIKEGFDAVFEPAVIEQFALAEPLPQPWLDQQRQAMREGHCNLLPERMIDPMVNAQAVRDIMYARLIEDYASQGAVVIAGNGHVRKDLGIYVWLTPALRERVTVFGYVESESGDALAYDRVRFMPAHARPDPCESFRQSMQRKKTSN